MVKIFVYVICFLVISKKNEYTETGKIVAELPLWTILSMMYFLWLYAAKIKVLQMQIQQSYKS